MRNVNIIDTLTSFDIQEIVKIGGKIFEIYEGVIYRENFKISPFRKNVETIFALRKNYKDEHNDLMQGLVKILMISLYGFHIRRDIDPSYKCKSQHWMETDYDQNVLDYWRLPNGNSIVKFKKDDGLDGDNDVKKTMPSHLGAFILSNSKRIMNNFIRESNGFFNDSIYYGDTDSLYIEKKHWDVLDKAELVGKSLCQRKNDYETRGIFSGLFLAPIIKYCLTINQFGVIQQQMIFKGFIDSRKLLDRSQYFDMLEGKKISAMLPKSWKKSFNHGIIIPTTMRGGDKCKGEILCDGCNNQVNENKEIEANLNFFKREARNQFGHMLPYFVE